MQVAENKLFYRIDKNRNNIIFQNVYICLYYDNNNDKSSGSIVNSNEITRSIVVWDMKTVS